MPPQSQLSNPYYANIEVRNKINGICDKIHYKIENEEISNSDSDCQKSQICYNKRREYDAFTQKSYQMHLNSLWVFLWKNCKYVRFDCIPIVVLLIGSLGILGLYFNVTNSAVIDAEKIYDATDLPTLKSYFPSQDDDYIFYTPGDPFLEQLMENVRIDLSLPHTRIQSFSSSTDMLLSMEDKKSTNSFAINFVTYPRNFTIGGLEYSISSTTIQIDAGEKLFNDKDVVGIRDQDGYQQSGFLTLQHVIDLNFVKLTTDQRSPFEIQISPLPTIQLERIDSDRLVIFGTFFAILLNILLLSTFVVPLVEEKDNGIKEFLVLTSTFNYLNGITFYLVRSIIYLIFTLAALAIGYKYAALGSIPIVYITVLSIVFVCSTMCYAFLISVFFISVFYAKVGGCILLIIPYILFLSVGQFSTIFPFSPLHVFSTSTFLEGIQIMQIFTNKRHEFGFQSLFINVTPTSSKLISILCILLVQGVLYAILYLYFSYVLPGKGGMKHSCFFFLQRNFWQSHLPCNNSIEMGTLTDKSIVIRQLNKTIQNGCRDETKVIINDLNMDIGNNRITVLLGHNGAGKTTTINMIIGSVPRTSGHISVCGDSQVASYRHAIGYCPQHTVSMHYMTCLEHLQFFAELRGKSRGEAHALAVDLLGQLNLADKANEVGKKLSGGMKRRLSLGMAIIGDTQVVILDEPSSGLDVESRRELWNILLELRRNKSVLITTHHMEEAEVLGDTISILSHGRLIQTGTPLQLKRLYGCGYVLKLLTNKHFDQMRVLQVVQSIVTAAKIKSCVHPTVCINLPYEAIDKYEELLKHLEECSTQYGIVSISVADSTMEDVFLNCETADNTDSPSHTVVIPNVPYKKIKTKIADLNKDPKMLAHQSFAVFYKKFIYIKREYMYFLFMFAIPFITTVIAISLVKLQEPISDSDSLPLNLHHANKSIIYLKSSSEFKKMRTILETEIRKFNSIPIDIKSGDESSFERVLLDVEAENLPHFYDNVIGAIDIDNVNSAPTMRVFISSNLIHSSAILINLIDNAILKYSGDESDSIGTSYLPIHRIAEISPTRLEYYAAIVPIGLFFYMLFYVSLPFKEEKTKFKYLQAMPRFTYWISYTFFDVLLHSAMCGLLYLFQCALVTEDLYNKQELAWLTATFIFYGISYLPLLYVMSSVCRSMSTLSTYLFFVLIISSILPLLTSSNQQSMARYEEIITVLCFLPDFSLNHQLRLINENFFVRRRNELVKLKTHNVNFNRSQMPLLNTMTFYLYAVFLYIIFEFFLIFIWENIRRRQKMLEAFRFNYCFRSSKLANSKTEVDEVLAEKDRVDTIIRDDENENYPLIVSNLRKSYDKAEYVVQGLNFAVDKGECFGLLGVNGAGKTSTFQMITVNESITNGNVLIDGINILTHENLYKLRFGYCPQADCLNNFMTSYEILKYMALLRGTSFKCVDDEVTNMLRRLDLVKYKNTQIRHYSGGTKRKLNTAIAMIGNPSLVLLDEPTTGVDPISRRYMWQCIKDFQKDNKTVVLTSHSMDECEQLCNRLAIMAKGQMQCLGNIPTLKKNYGSGFTISFRVHENCSSSNIDIIKAKILRLFNCELREQHAEMLTYFVKERTVQWSTVFFEIQKFFKSNRDIIEEYSVNETTLEDIFLSFDCIK